MGFKESAKDLPPVEKCVPFIKINKNDNNFFILESNVVIKYNSGFCGQH